MDEKKCSYCGSTKNYYAKGLCRACYRRSLRNGTPDRANGVIGNSRKAVLDLYRAGKKQSEIARLTHYSQQNVSTILKKYYKKTNFDEIRAMTIEEMANLFSWLNGVKTAAEWRSWLEQEATDDN